jgi:tRNA nucleotidyltransferase (CCA-adding enzyme)
VIGRSQKKRINLHELFACYGGGGHQGAASINMIGREGQDFYDEFRLYLEKALLPATCVRDIMTTKVLTLKENDKLLNASIYMEEIDHNGLPVVNAEGKLCGFITLRDIMKARKASQMNAPVSAYMSRVVISAGPEMTMREVERLFYKHHIGHLPVVENGELTGIVTRRDFLDYQKRRDEIRFPAKNAAVNEASLPAAE